MAGIGTQLDGRALTDALRSLGRAAESPRGGMEALGAHFVFSTQRNFERETAPDGTRWPPLSPRTAAKRSGRGRRGFDNMLRVTTRLYRSINYEATDSTVEWGTNVQYGRIHQLGGVIDMQPRSGTVNLKKIRRKGGGFRSRFARSGSKGAESRVVSIRGHQVRIPARPYLGVSNADRQAVTDIVSDYLRSEATPGMSTIPEIKARLSAAGTPFTFVRGATALAQVKDRPDAVLPVAFVLTAREVTGENERATGQVLQRMERDIMVVIIVEDLGDADGDAVQDPLEELKAWVRGKLIGFLPTDMAESGDPISHVGGEVIEATAGCVWFEDTFSAPIYITETS